MKNYQADSIRNIAVLGHGGEGKTTLTEAMLFNAGLLDRMGKVDDGTTVSDYDPEETKRHISISAAVAPFEWNGTKVNLIDAPGFFDFYGEVYEAMALADSAIIVCSAVSGPVVGRFCDSNAALVAFFKSSNEYNKVPSRSKITLFCSSCSPESR